MKTRAILAILLCACIAGTSGIFIKYMTTMDSGSLAWMRTGIPVLLILPWMHYQKRGFFRSNPKMVMIASGLNATRMFLFFMAFIYTSIGTAIITLYTWPIWVSILGSIFLKEKFKVQQWIFLLTAFVGIIIAYSDQTFSLADRDFVGILAAIGSAFFYSWTVIVFKKEIKNYHPLEIVFYQNLIGAVVFFPFLWMIMPTVDVAHLQVGVCYALIVGVGVFGLFFYALNHLKASVASSLMYVEVVSAIVLSYLILDDQLSPRMMIGGSLILLSSFMITRLNTDEVPS